MSKKNFEMEQLLQEVAEITQSGLPFMEGKEKLEVKGDVLNKTLTVDQYGFMEGEEGEYVAFTVKEFPNHFMYGASVVSEGFKKFDQKFNEEQKEMIMKHGLTILLGERKSANKRNYTTLTFFPK
jgi:hypothetical protein